MQLKNETTFDTPKKKKWLMIYLEFEITLDSPQKRKYVWYTKKKKIWYSLNTIQKRKCIWYNSKTKLLLIQEVIFYTPQ